jgi:hypothetical protein
MWKISINVACNIQKCVVEQSNRSNMEHKSSGLQIYPIYSRIDKNISKKINNEEGPWDFI